MDRGIVTNEVSGTTSEHLGGAQAFAQHLRDNPEATSEAPSQLAGRFGLPVSFVEDVLGRVSRRRAVPTPLTRSIDVDSPIRSACEAAYQAAKELIKRLTNSPTRYVWLTTSVTLGLIVIAIVTMLRKVDTLEPRHERAILMMNVFFMGVLCTHFVAYYRHALARNAIKGAGIVLANFVVATTFLVFVTPGSENMALPARLTATAVGGVMLTMLYSVGGIFAAVIGGYARIKKEDREERGLTRQQRLERLFEIQAKLADGRREGTRSAFWEAPWMVVLQRWLFGLAVASGLVLGSLSVLTLGSLHRVLGMSGTEIGATNAPSGYIVAQAALGLIETTLLAGIAFLSRRPWRALLAGATMQVSQYPLFFVAVRFLGDRHFDTYFTTAYYVQAIVFTVVVTLAASLGAVVEERADKARRIRESDPATLVAEMIRIQWQLAVKPSRVCVMVVDAVKSSRMKASADPLVVEWTFREFQKWIEEVSERYGGSILNTMGDGAVVQFDNCLSAYRAAQALQTDVDELNRTRNRLSLPFRLRIGLHVGHVEGDLATVQFNEVIDIAAHVEKIAPNGSIAMTEMVAQDLTDEKLLPIKDPVDGHEVFMAIQSRLDT
ncbi:MAG: adenylate/guanylate cyclase domain-containing protein [Fimbriimonadaceae bacterium]|nr:adenylate/guanylate cyclase domain-containing protein [Fimbriimonadaceae bacterium]